MSLNDIFNNMNPTPTPTLAVINQTTIIVSNDPRATLWISNKMQGSIDEFARMGTQTGRNATLNSIAYSLGRFVPKWLTETDITNQLLNACTTNGLINEDGQQQCTQTIRSGISKGILDPRDPPLREDDGTNGLSNLINGPVTIELNKKVTPKNVFTLTDHIEPTNPNTPWAAPEPFPNSNLPTFPLHALGKYADLVTQISEDTQTPIDMAAMLILAAFSAAVGKGVRIQILNTWTEQLSLYIAVVLPSGEGKSPVFKRLMQPLTEMEKELSEQAMPAILEARQHRRILESRAKNAETKAAKTLGQDRTDAIAEATGINLELATTHVPPMPRLFVDDVTSEALVQVLAEQGGQISLLSEEGGIFATLAGRYSSGVPNLDAVLKAHDGGMIRVDRKTSDPLFVENPALTMGLAVQPSVLTALADETALRGRGLIARFLFSIPQSRVGNRDVKRRMNQPTNNQHDRIYKTTLQALVQHRNSEHKIMMTTEALSEFTTLAVELETRRDRDEGDLTGILDWSAKLDGAVARIAGLLALSENPTNIEEAIVDVNIMQRAITIARYLIEHASAALDLMDPTHADNAAAEQVLRWIRKNGLAEITVSEAHRALRGRKLLKHINDVNEAFLLLTSHGYLRLNPTLNPTPVGRPKGPVFSVNPLDTVEA
jgi:hypothetical protein